MVLYYVTLIVAWTLGLFAKVTQLVPDFIVRCRKEWLLFFFRLGVIGDGGGRDRVLKKEIRKLHESDVGFVKIPLRAAWREESLELSEEELQDVKKGLPEFFKSRNGRDQSVDLSINSLPKV